MNLKNLNVKNKIPNSFKTKLLNRRLNNIFNRFENSFKPNSNFIVGVSGGADSLALAFLSKLYAFKNNLKPKFYIVDHKLRNISTEEASKVKKVLRSFNIHSKILTWRGKRPSTKIQSTARKIRYDLLFSECKKLKINNLVVGHHIDDLIENFFIRMARGSGLKGLVSLGVQTQIDSINLLRPLINIDKKDLLFISKFVFNFYVDDISNYNMKFNRIKIRKFIEQLRPMGLDKKKIQLTIENLKRSDQTIRYYVEKNKKINSTICQKNTELILKRAFFDNSYEVVFRSLSDLIQFIGKRHNPVRGKKIDKILNKIENKRLFKETLGGCVIKMVNQTVILAKEF